MVIPCIYGVAITFIIENNVKLGKAKLQQIFKNPCDSKNFKAMIVVRIMHLNMNKREITRH